MKTLLSIIFLLSLPYVLFAQITVKQNGETVKPNTTGINVNSDDVITVIIPNSKAHKTCMNDMSLTVSLTYSKETNNDKQKMQSQQQKKNKRTKSTKSDEPNNKIKFKLTNKNTWVCSFKVQEYWKEKEGLGYIGLINGTNCDKELSTLKDGLNKYTFYLMP